jgi:hypothetical protein
MESSVGLEVSNPQMFELHLELRIMPIDRGAIYEDTLDESLSALQLGSVTGGGTLISKEKEPLSCDVEIELRDGGGDSLKELLDVLSAYKIPKGSYLRCSDETQIELGNLEGLGLYLNGIDLPAEVYQECDVNYVIAEANRLLAGNGAYFSYWMGPEYTALYFYGPSFEAMQDTLRPLINGYPLCNKSYVTQIA